MRLYYKTEKKTIHEITLSDFDSVKGIYNDLTIGMELRAIFTLYAVIM